MQQKPHSTYQAVKLVIGGEKRLFGLRLKTQTKENTQFVIRRTCNDNSDVQKNYLMNTSGQ
jgi:hypothetical protein